MQGLTSREAAERKNRYGPNALPGHRQPLWHLVGRQLKGVFNMLLLLAAGVTFAIGEILDGAFILFFILLGTTLNIYQEYKSNAAVAKLKAFLVRRTRVIRDGREQEINHEDVVPGDLLSLQTGDIVPADAIVLQARNLLVDETTFTGESVPVSKQPGQPDGRDQDESVLLQGVCIVQGQVFAETTATGTNTRLASIARTTASVQEESELVKGVDRISGFILRITLITLLFVVLANLLLEGKETFPQLLVFALALAVSVIPEALPLVLTFSLSRGALRFARQDVVVKRLSSVQDLGSINLLCTDKTGTLTENKLSVAGEWKAPDSSFSPLVLSRLAAQDLDGAHPEPFDLAIDQALTDDQRKTLAHFQILEREPFEPSQRSNGVLLRMPDGRSLHVRRGSPESLAIHMPSLPAGMARWLQQEEVQGHRVLGITADVGHGPFWVGLIAFMDRLKPSTRAALDAAVDLRVGITIITGDALRVALAVGREAGLVERDDQAMEASAFFALPREEQLARVGHIRVFARTTPEQKLLLIQQLKTQFTVGFLGEGVNDGPALKAAHVSMVVPSASDIARETADIVLLNNDLGVIVNGIRTGRETHANTLKYIRATLISNFGNFYAVAIGSLLIDFLPMLPKQILLLNLLSDFPMMAIAMDRVPPAETARPQRYDLRSLYLLIIVLGLVSTVFDFVFFSLFYRMSPDVLQTNWFMASVLTELLLIFSIRTLLPAHKSGWPAPLLLILSVVAMTVTLLIPYVPWTRAFFSFARPTPAHMMLIGGLACLYLVVTELIKKPLVRFLARHESHAVSPVIP